MQTKLRWFALISLTLAGIAAAQTATEDAIAVAYAHNAFQLTSSSPSVTRTFVVDSTNLLSFSVIAVSRTLTIAFQAPNAVRYTVGSPATSTFDSSITPIDTTGVGGASYRGTIANPPAGTWTLIVTEHAALSSPLDILATTYFNNTTRLFLAGGGDSYPAGTNIRLALVAFDRTTRVSGLSITARIFRPGDPTFTPAILTFHDDGSGGDETAGDRIYETFVNPGQPGHYQVQVDANGSASTGAFQRTAAVELRVVPRDVQIVTFHDEGIDDDGDGLFDYVGLTPTVNATKSGDYDVSVRLRASNGNEMLRAVETYLPLGTSSGTTVVFSAADMARELGVDGPYDVTEIRCEEELTNDLFPADVRYDVGRTSPYHLSDLQHARLHLSGGGSAAGSDTNSNKKFDLLQIFIGIIADFSGSYTGSASLVDSNGHEIGFASGTIFMNAGTNTITINFEGARIGKNGVDGPYVVSNLILFGDNASLLVNRAFTTPPMAASLFEGYITPKRRIARH